MVNLELNKLKLKGRTKCDCGYEFTSKDITNLIKNEDVHYYGGRVEYYCIAICTNCKKEMILMLESYDNTYRIIDIAENIQNVSKIEKLSQNNTKNVIKDTESDSKNVKVQKTNENVVICENCGRTFKSFAGLSSHLKKCTSNN